MLMRDTKFIQAQLLWLSATAQAVFSVGSVHIMLFYLVAVFSSVQFPSHFPS